MPVPGRSTIECDGDLDRRMTPRNETMMTRTRTSYPATVTPPGLLSGAAGEPHVPDAGAPRVAVVGIHGHGNSHLVNARALQDKGLCRLVAVADPRPPTPGSVDSDVHVFA